MYQTKIEEWNRGAKEKTNQNHRRPSSSNPTKLSSPAAAQSPCSHRRSRERRRTSLSQHLLPSPARHHLSPSHLPYLLLSRASGFVFCFPVLLSDCLFYFCLLIVLMGHVSTMQTKLSHISHLSNGTCVN
jgi:hypothetical protein